ncbi:hypothetical protein SPRG_07255 [Saprolegnia parasitica CBS 223.65]|uniref:Eukaryotic translation initiation factor 3 subunit K n=1 Tax=Saprolegnia parasitica (strain CBS 223.65) TaxID=695850 RepID=A0A067CBU0_SAPPC|nr:hypothetical protein SPRG_07255 [Saprolegnia parasitica CBS 223.65]KDO27978.1 hypothetical protein SPRG_07255 [Saprolegnia parasitica CBS 223.65]|eukprot:XP_012201427.1 hypothetical protein SPRG_07255 [Saprolegnia parasitica CBS 223.65]
MSRFVSFEKDATSKAATAVRAQVAADGMDEKLVGLLEAYLDEQIASNVVDEEANLMLLKLYTIYPVKPEQHQTRVAQVLAKGLMALPSKYFLGATYMVTEALRKDKNITDLLKAGDVLQSCLFTDFWTLDLPFAKKIPGFEQAVRAFILSTIAKSHEVVAKAFVQAQLNLSEKDVASLVAELGWTTKDASYVVTPNSENQMRPKKFKEDIEFADILDTIQVLSR